MASSWRREMFFAMAFFGVLFALNIIFFGLFWAGGLPRGRYVIAPVIGFLDSLAVMLLGFMIREIRASTLGGFILEMVAIAAATGFSVLISEGGVWRYRNAIGLGLFAGTLTHIFFSLPPLRSYENFAFFIFVAAAVAPAIVLGFDINWTVRLGRYRIRMI